MLTTLCEEVMKSKTVSKPNIFKSCNAYGEGARDPPEIDEMKGCVIKALTASHGSLHYTAAEGIQDIFPNLLQHGTCA
jgi:hypothetical protein